MDSSPSRRAFNLWMGGALLAPSFALRAQVPRQYIGDMHSHYGMFRRDYPAVDMGRQMRETGTTLLAWAIVDDTSWITGTDMEGAGPRPIMSEYTELRDVVERLAKRGLPEGALNNICIGNYARVLKQAMNGAAKA